MQLQALQCTVDTAWPLETARRPPARSVRVEDPSGSLGGTGHWCLKLMKSGFTRAKVPWLKNRDILSARIDAKKQTDGTFKDTKKNV